MGIPSKNVVSHALRMYDGYQRLYLVHKNPRWEMLGFPATKRRNNETVEQALGRLQEEYALKERPRSTFTRQLPILEQHLVSPGTRQATDYRHELWLETLRSVQRKKRWTPVGWQWLPEKELLQRDDVSPTVKVLLAPAHRLPPLPPAGDDSLEAQFIRFLHQKQPFEAAISFEKRCQSSLVPILANQTKMQESDLQDLLQDTWLKVLLRADEYRPDTSPLGWMRYIATNLARDTARSARSRRNRGDAALKQVGSSEKTPLEQALDHEALLRFEQLIRPLTPREQELARLHYVEGLHPAEIAARRSLREGSIHTALSVLRGRLFDHWQTRQR
ncbi:MAG: sigma-70 family RNA polymerase sigma factor [Gemmataceae bacterium]